MHDTITKSVYAESVVEKTPNGEDDGEYLKVPISSTRKDRDGDRFSPDGLRDLRDQIKGQNRPVFGNHGQSADGGLFAPRYQWQDIIGGQEDAEIEEDGDDEVLNSYVRPNPANEEGQMLLEYTKAGMPVGFSVGFRPLEKESNEETGENVFHSTDLLETSAVGIQSNLDSVHTDAAAADAELVAKGAASRVAARHPDVDEGTLADEIVSELSGYDGDAGTGTGTDAGAASERTHQQRETTMSDTKADDEDDEQYVTRRELEDALEDHQSDLVKGLAAELDGSLGDDRDDTGGDNGKSEDGTAELKSLVEKNAESISDLKDAMEDATPEDARRKDAADPDEGTDDETAADDEDATEDGANESTDDEKSYAAGEGGWM